DIHHFRGKQNSEDAPIPRAQFGFEITHETLAFQFGSIELHTFRGDPEIQLWHGFADHFLARISERAQESVINIHKDTIRKTHNAVHRRTVMKSRAEKAVRNSKVRRRWGLSTVFLPCWRTRHRAQNLISES